jgi:hypothetical protein
MKNLLLILAVLLSVNCIAQNRFTKIVASADSAFHEQYKIAAIKAANKTDSILGIKKHPYFYSCIWECYYCDYKKTIITDGEILNIFMDGYMAGQQSFYYNKDFNYELLELKLKKIKRELNIKN